MAKWRFWKTSSQVTHVGVPQATSATTAKTREQRSRETRPSDRFILAGTGIGFLPRRSHHSLDIDKFDATRYNAQQVLDILADVSPEVSLAVWNTLRLGAVNWKFKVENPAQTRILKRAQVKLLDFFDNEVNVRYGGFPSIVRQLFLTSFLQGAHCIELELSEDLTKPVDLHTVQPFTIRFARDSKTWKYVMFQQTATQPTAVELNPNLVWYVPLDPAVDDPYGRAPAASVIWPLTFDLQFIRDLKQAIHIAGWGRIDASIIQEVAIKNAPPDVRNDSKRLKEYLDQIISDVKSAFEDIRSDDTFIHTDSVKLDTIDPVGNRAAAVTPLARLLELRLTRGLKQLPIMMASAEGRTETQGTVQYEIYANGLQAMRDIVGFTLSRIAETVLRVQGIQTKVTVEWSTVRTKDRLREAQAEQLEIINATWKRVQGWITNDEATMEVTGKPKAEGEPEVISTPGPIPEMPNSIPAHEAGPEPSPTDGEPGRPVETGRNGHHLGQATVYGREVTS